MKKHITFIFIFFILNETYAADYFWVGGTGNWSNYSLHWATTSGGTNMHTQIPQSVDNVFFDINSFTNSNQVIYIDQTIVYCKNMTWTGVLNNPRMFNDNNQLQIYGSLTLDPNMSLTGNINGSLNFVSTFNGNSIDMAGVKMVNSLNFDGIGGEWTLQDSIYTDDGGLMLYNGKLFTNGKNLILNYISILNNSTIDLSSSKVKLFSADASWELATSANIYAGTSTISGASLFSGGGKNYFNLIALPTASFILIEGNNYFNKVHLNTNAQFFGSNSMDSLLFTPGYSYTLEAGQTQTVNLFFDANGSCTQSIELGSNLNGTKANLSMPSGSVITNFLSIKNINAFGGATYIANNSIDLGNNSGWIINTVLPSTYYWVGNAGNWNDVSHWSLSSGGSPAGCLPLHSDNVIFDNQSFSTSGQVVNINVPAYCKNMTWTGVLNNPRMFN
ncbi:MAG: hypothetical protein V4667_10640, partial [Bacteroidota bacterium]